MRNQTSLFAVFNQFDSADDNKFGNTDQHNDHVND